MSGSKIENVTELVKKCVPQIESVFPRAGVPNLSLVWSEGMAMGDII